MPMLKSALCIHILHPKHPSLSKYNHHQPRSMPRPTNTSPRNPLVHIAVPGRAVLNVAGTAPRAAARARRAAARLVVVLDGSWLGASNV